MTAGAPSGMIKVPLSTYIYAGIFPLNTDSVSYGGLMRSMCFDYQNLASLSLAYTS